MEARIEELQACGGNRLPSTSYARNSAWLHLGGHAFTVLSWLRLLALDGDLARAEPKTLRFRLLSAPARYVRHARQRVLKIPVGWAGATNLADAFERSAPCTRLDRRCPGPRTTPAGPPEQWNRAPTRAVRAAGLLGDLHKP